MTLSQNAQKLFSFLKDTGGAWEQKCIEALYPKPEYKENPTSYWQWDANMYGQDQQRPVNGICIEFKATANYSSEISAAYKELRLAGKAGEKNNGYNEYFLFAK